MMGLRSPDDSVRSVTLARSNQAHEFHPYVQPLVNRSEPNAR